MAKRNTVWVLFKLRAKRGRFSTWVVDPRITSKKCWQRTKEYYNLSSDSRRARLWADHGTKYTLDYLAESTDKQVLLTMLELMEKGE